MVGRKALEEDRRIVQQRLKGRRRSLHYQCRKEIRGNKRKVAADRFQIIGQEEEMPTVADDQHVDTQQR